MHTLADALKPDISVKEEDHGEEYRWILSNQGLGEIGFIALNQTKSSTGIYYCLNIQCSDDFIKRKEIILQKITKMWSEYITKKLGIFDRNELK